jgi:hypothetical protein
VGWIPSGSNLIGRHGEPLAMLVLDSHLIARALTKRQDQDTNLAFSDGIRYRQ